MTSQPVLLDTDVLSAILRGQPQAIVRAQLYLEEHQRFTFSVITYYEVRRGFLAKGAMRQQAVFEQLCLASALLPLTDEIAHRAAAIYATLYTRGKLIGDADILIAATALTHGLALATNNEAHLRRIDELQIDNWLASKP